MIAALLLFLVGQPTLEAEVSLLRGAVEALQYEQALTHLRIDLGGLQAFAPQKRAFRALLPSENPVARAKLVVLHLWASHCPACLPEDPQWRELAQRLEEDYQGEVRVLLVSTWEISSASALVLRGAPTASCARHNYHDLDERILHALPQARLPTTLLLDREGVVRQAFVGPLRRGALVNAVARLWRCLSRITTSNARGAGCGSPDLCVKA